MTTIEAKRNSQIIHPIFARHETFHPRFGWLKKGFDKASEQPDLFTDDMAPSILGVGKNMVKAIKYWCIAYKVLEEVQERGKGRILVPTAFGNRLLNNDGWDPYLEDPASLWLLHWSLLSLPNYATTWHYTFNVFNRPSFMVEDIQHGIFEYAKREFPNSRITASSVARDVSCLLRMYVEDSSRQLTEDSIDSPFTDLGLVKQYGDRRHFAMSIGPKIGLTHEIIAASCLDFAATAEEGAKTISIARLTYEQNSPGQCFKLTEGIISEAIESVAIAVEDIEMSKTAGLVQMAFSRDPYSIINDVLNGYYKRIHN
jgi:hypothetical protein